MVKPMAKCESNELELSGRLTGFDLKTEKLVSAEQNSHKPWKLSGARPNLNFCLLQC